MSKQSKAGTGNSKSKAPKSEEVLIDTEYDEEDEPMYITLAFDDKSELECEILGTFDFEEKEYMALLANDGSDEVYIYEYMEINDEEFELKDIEDDELFQKVSDELEKLSI